MTRAPNRALAFLAAPEAWAPGDLSIRCLLTSPEAAA